MGYGWVEGRTDGQTLIEYSKMLIVNLHGGYIGIHFKVLSTLLYV